jgi:phage-related protein
MPLQTFDPPVGPSPGTRKGRDMDILEAEFGDGYSQPTPNGYNHMRRTLSLNWDGLSRRQADYISQFFEEHGGTKAFYYTPANETKPVKWICSSWEESVQGITKITAEFKQSFTLES